jgi:hypothetical protein
MTTKDSVLIEIRNPLRWGRSIRGFAFLVVLALSMGCGPIGPFSGGRLSGDEGNWPEDWSRFADVTQIQLETGPKDPHSVNLWFVVVDDEAYLATSLLVGTEVPEEREWVRNVTADPRVRIRIEGILYQARLETVSDSIVKGRVFDAFKLKYPELEESRGDAARYFKVAKRSVAVMP